MISRRHRAPGGSRGERVVEAVAVGLAGGGLAASVGSLLDLALPAAAIGTLNGLIGGARRIYDWRRPRGLLALVLDSTWALPMSAAALVPHMVAAIQPNGGGYVAELSERADRHVYERGLRFRKGFAITIGNVVSQAGDVRESMRRWRLVTDHEHVHVWQGRWLGPLYPLLYVGWSIAGAVVGAAVWTVRRRDAPFLKVVETCAYHLNPFEWWAYSRDDRWPPPGIVAGMGWHSPAARPFGAGRATGRVIGGSRGRRD